MTQDIALRLARVRGVLRSKELAAWVVFSADEHLSEYVADHWKLRAWLTGFTGSAGTLVVTGDRALLWTDSRYWEQAAGQLAGTGIELMRSGLPATATVGGWLAAHLQAGDHVGLDPRTIPMRRFEELERELDRHSIVLAGDCELTDAVWPERPLPPQAGVRIFEYGQLPVAQKRETIARSLAQVRAEAVFVTALDEVAWLTNLRGSDVAYTPVFEAYCLMCGHGTILYVDPAKLAADGVAGHLERNHIHPVDIRRMPQDLCSRLAGHTVALDPGSTTEAVFDMLRRDGRIEVVRTPSAVELAKSRKTPAELDMLRRTMACDGAALVELFAWLDSALGHGTTVTELDVSDRLHALRARQPGFVDLSFATIAAAGPHAALPHYTPDAQSNATVNGSPVLLVDSGGQYTGGTTDITRTVAACPEADIPAQLKRDFTAVLRGHIALARARFPQGTYACQIDTLARAPLWEIGADYGHGTGHGVGFCLSVHEGPVHISPKCPPNERTRIVPGLVISNEPGLYRPGLWGIRTENLVTPLAVEAQDGSGPMTAFETLSLCPIDVRLIERAMMKPEETGWLNAYHRTVRDALEPLVGPAAREWLAAATRPI